MLACRPTSAAVIRVLCAPGGGRADVGIGPYEKTGSEAVGAAFMAARAAESDAPTPSAVSPDA